MFRNRNEELCHLIEVYQTEEDVCVQAEIELFSTEMIKNMIEDKVLDSQFATKVYEFDAKMFLQIFNTAISAFYGKIGFKESLRIVGEVKYFYQAIEGYKAIYDQLKVNLLNLRRESYELREKLEHMTLMKDFDKLPDEEKSQIHDMTEVLKPYAVLPKPVKSKRVPNWAEHYFRLALIENSYEEEQNNYFSLFRTET